MKQAFISYSRKDIAFARRLADDLDFRGISVWIDLQDIAAGEIWVSEIGKAVADCPFFLLLLSPYSIESKYVQREYELALSIGKKIIPILAQDCRIPEAISHIQYIDMLSYEDGLYRLLRVFPQNAFEESRSMEKVLSRLESEERTVRINALNLIAYGGLHEAFEKVILVLQDSDAEVRAAAGVALDRLNDARAIPHLIQAIHDSDSNVCANAGWALVHLGSQVVADVVEVLETSKSIQAKEMAYLILERIGGREADEAIARYRKTLR